MTQTWTQFLIKFLVGMIALLCMVGFAYIKFDAGFFVSGAVMFIAVVSIPYPIRGWSLVNFIQGNGWTNEWDKAFPVK